MTACVKTTCPYCGVGCGVLAKDRGDGTAEIAGDPAHPANFGRLCVKGSHLGDTVDLDGRLLHPEIGGVRVDWDAAIAKVAGAFENAIRQHGPDSVAFYVSGQLLTEDYYVANKLMKGFIGSGNIDTNSRLCMASSVAGHKRGFGADIVPGTYEDLEQADLIVLVGSNLDWCHPVLAQRIAAAREKNPALKVVNVDPRRTATSAGADLHLSLAPGSDVALFGGLLAHLLETGHCDEAYVAAHVAGAQEALSAARGIGFDGAVKLTGLDAETLRRFYALWAGTRKVVTVYSQGVNQWSSGVDKVNAILNCHLFTGRIGKPGCGPFSVTGQPNAMGGREVGGLANMLAAHMELTDPAHRDRVQRFWGAPRMAAQPGLKAVDMFAALAEGRIKALWVMATNPAVSLPQADRIRAALQKSDVFVAVSDVMRRTDTTELADVLLPAAAWGEKDGTVTNSERRISRQRAFLSAPGEARPDWRIVSDVAAAMGWKDAFAYDGPAAIFREHAALSGFENEAGQRLFDISAHERITESEFDALAPFHWPAPKASGALKASNGARLFAEGGFPTQDGKARMIAVSPSARGEGLSDAYPLILNTGRVRDHWHTMTRTAKSARLSRHIAEPFVEIHPNDAAALGLEPASLARLISREGVMVARVLVTDRQQAGSVFAPMHWTAQTASHGRVDALVAPLTDPISGQPESKRTPVRLEPYEAAWHGFAISRAEPVLTGIGYWAKARTDVGWRVELADRAPLSDINPVALRLLGLEREPEVEALAYEDARTGAQRFAAYRGDRLLGALFISEAPVAAARDWLADMLDSADEDQGAGARLKLLAGRAGGAEADQGPIVCVCHNVGARRIEAAVDAGADSLDAIGAACAAGTNCGSCRPELKALLARRTKPIAAE